MQNLTHIYQVGQKVRCRMDGKFFKGTIKEVHEDHLIIDIPDVSDHCWFEPGFNLCDVFPEYNFF